MVAMDRMKIESLFMAGGASIKDAMMRLTDTAAKILFIVDDEKRLVGTVTDGDLRRGIINGSLLSSPVHGVMKEGFISVAADEEEPEKKARDLMQRCAVEHVPIMDDDGRVSAIVTWRDCLDNAMPEEGRQGLETVVVVMAGGKGTRLDPFTRILPKPLIPLGDKPIVEHIMERFFARGFARFALVVNYKKEMLKTYFSDRPFPYGVELVEEPSYLGTAGGLSLLRDKLKETFIVTNCDTLLDGRVDFLGWHRERRNTMTIIGSHKEVTVPYGVLNMTNGSLLSIDEKPRLDLFVNTGTYVFEPEVFDFMGHGEPLDMDMLIQRLCDSDRASVGVYPHWGGWFDVGQWEEYRESVRRMTEGHDV